jgi:hypothetical protein
MGQPGSDFLQYSMKKYFIISLVFGIVASFCFAFLASAQDVALPTNVGLPGSGGSNLAGVISNFTNWLLGIFGFVAIISFLISGMMYFFSAGDDKAQEKAKKQMTWSITGVIIGLIGLVVIYAVDMFLNGGGASFGGGGSSVINNAANSSMTGSGSSSSAGSSNSSEWLGTGTNPKTGNRVFIDQQGRSFELISGSLTPMNDTTTNSGPDSSYQP